MSVVANMKQALFEKYRPETVDDVVYPDKEKELIIKTSIENGYIQGNIIAFGPGGVGKTTISKVLQRAIIKHKSDIKLLGRKTTDIDDLLPWLIQKPVKSVQKLVIIEEIDRLSAAAQTLIKNGPMEDHQPKISFIATTNRVDKIDPALLQRFNIKLNFNKVNMEGLYFRLLKILQTEGIAYTEEDVWEFTKSFANKGIRDVLNNVQIASISGRFDVSLIKGFLSSTGQENDVFIQMKYYIYYLSQLNVDDLYQLMFNITMNSDVYKAYDAIIQIVENDFSFNYDAVFRQFIDDPEILVNFKTLSVQYYQDLDTKKNPKLHFISLLNEFIVELYNMKRGSSKIYIRV